MISVIVPVHNEAKNLEALLPHLKSLENSAKNEILICGSPSTSDTSEKICEQNNIAFIQCKAKGRASQMNEGAALAKGDIFAFLHADVRPPHQFFTDIHSTLEGSHDAGFFSYQFDRNTFFLDINAKFTKNDGLFTGGGDQCLFIKKSVFNDLGRFNENQVLMEDFEFFRRMKKNKIPYKIVDNDMVVSARKYDYNSYLRVNLSNLLMFMLFQFGYSPEGLMALHKKLIRTS